MLGASWAGPSGGDVHRAALFDGARLVGAVRLSAMRRVRRGHAAQVQVEAQEPLHADALLAAVSAFADDWTAFDRLQLEVSAGSPAADVAERHGFVREVCRVDRRGSGDELGFGRLRPGFVPRPPGGAPPWPARHRRTPTEVTLRALSAADSAAICALSIAPTAVWGTLQTPWSNEVFYADRFVGTGPEHAVFVLEADGEIAGNGGLHPTGIPGVDAMGMAISAEWQGCGLGARLLDQVIATWHARESRRLELGVWVDNTRAHALYVSRGFRAEGTLRCDSIRGGGHASSLEMALRRRP